MAKKKNKYEAFFDQLKKDIYEIYTSRFDEYLNNYLSNYIANIEAWDQRILVSTLCGIFENNYFCLMTVFYDEFFDVDDDLDWEHINNEIKYLTNNYTDEDFDYPICEKIEDVVREVRIKWSDDMDRNRLYHTIEEEVERRKNHPAHEQSNK